MIYGLWICGIVLMWSLVTGQCIFDIWYCILVSVFALSYATLHVRVQFFAYRSFPSIFRSYLPVFVLPFIPLPFTLSVVRLPLPFSSKNMKMKTIKRFSVRFRSFSTLVVILIPGYMEVVERGRERTEREGGARTRCKPPPSPQSGGLELEAWKL